MTPLATNHRFSYLGTNLTESSTFDTTDRTPDINTSTSHIGALVHGKDTEPLRLAFDAVETYVPILLFTLGFFGNALSVIVFSREAYRSTTTGFYMLVLASFDLNVILNLLVQRWLVSYFSETLGSTDTFCKLHQFCVFSGVGWSHWTLVAMSVDRCIAIRFPIKARVWCTISRAKKALVLIVVVFISRSLPFLWHGTVRHLDVGDRKIALCMLDLPPLDSNIYYLMGTVLNIISPFIVLTTSNVLIIRALRRRAAVRRELSQGSDHESHHEKALTSMLLSASLIFLVVLLPYAVDNVYWMVVALYRDQKDLTWMSNEHIGESNMSLRDTRWISKQFAVMLLFMNPVCNFYVYSVTCSKFREEAVAMFKKLCCRHRPDQFYSSSNGSSSVLKLAEHCQR